LGATRAKFSSQDEFLTQLAPYDDRVRGRKRSALTEALTRSIQPAAFGTLDELYEYFLVDVQLEGCARTSRLVAAISSVQLYVYHVLMNLEQDRRSPSDPAHIHVSPESIPADEWSWRQNYRVWEANRKVFLYPENYMEPELRDDKTPQFKDFESTLVWRYPEFRGLSIPTMRDLQERSFQPARHRAPTAERITRNASSCNMSAISSMRPTTFSPSSPWNR
jgi:ABC toxin N-terminal region